MVQFLLLLALSPLLVFAIHMAATRLVRRWFPGAGMQGVAFVCIAIGNIPMLSAIWLLYLRYLTSSSETLWALIYGLLVYNALAYTYFHVFNMSETARRIHILYAIETQKDLTVRDLMSLYSPEDMLSVRLDRLVSLGQVKCNGNRYFVNRCPMYYTAKVIAGWRRILGLSPQGERVSG